MLNREININSKQLRALTSIAKHIFFVGGVGSGKTFIDALWVYMKATKIQGSMGMMLAPTYDTLKNSTLQGLQDVFDNIIGLREGIHYVMNQKPPSNWGVQPYSILHNQRVMTFRNGSYLLLDTAENYNKHRGSQLDYLVIDEWRDIKPEAYQVLITRMRGTKTTELGIKTQILNTTTPPEDPDKIERYTLSQELDSDIIHTTTMDNLKNLPLDYLETLRTTLDELTYRREVLGESIRIGNLAAWAFDKDRNITYSEFKNDKKTAIIFDFDFNPQVVLMNQLIGSSKFGNPLWCVTKEFIFRPGNTENTCNELIAFLKQNDFHNEVILTGDYSGIARSTKSNYSDWVIIEEKFREAGYNYKVMISPTHSLRESVNSFNAILYNYEGDVRQMISSQCKYTVKDVQDAILVQTISGLKFEHGINNEKSHAIANLCDFAKNLFPIRRKQTESIMR